MSFSTWRFWSVPPDTSGLVLTMTPDCKHSKEFLRGEDLKLQILEATNDLEGKHPSTASQPQLPDSCITSSGVPPELHGARGSHVLHTCELEQVSAARGGSSAGRLPLGRSQHGRHGLTASQTTPVTATPLGDTRRRSEMC